MKEKWPVMDVLRPNSGNYGDWRYISLRLMLELDRFCQEQALTPLITSGIGGTHSAKSWHYKGCALDVMFPDVDLCDLPKTIFEVAQRYEFSGLGLYNQWALQKGGAKIGGMHFELDPEWKNWERKKLWVRTQDGDFAPSEEAYQKYFLLTTTPTGV